ncbi:MAG: NrtA/SsuA/CpmA family ABC transporter substrate-binding protein [Sutterella sp.]|nr:NrtA/SsuA/CpmA family ABC transporter substrate-binding protein [Sutterella sp.]
MVKPLKLILAGLLATSTLAMAMPTELNITYVKSPFNLQNIVMKERQMLEKAFEKEGVKVNWRVINSGAQQAQALTSGSLDVSAVMNTASLLMAASSGAPIQAVNGVAHPEDIFALVAKPGLTLTLADLKGKTIVGPKGTVLHQLLVAALKKAGLTMADVNFVNMDPGAALAAIMAGQADVGLLAANLIIKAQAAGSKVVTTAHGLVNPNLVMVARTGFMKEHPDALERVVKVEQEALRWIREHKDEALAIGAKEQGISVEDARKLYEGSHFYDQLTSADVEGLKADQAFLLENGMMTQPLDVTTLVWDKALKK